MAGMSRPVADFDAVYAGEPIRDGAERVPWNIGEPQPAIAALIEGGQVRGTVLDAGCGIGETTLYLVERGYTAVGLDNSATAIEQARERARQRRLDVEFGVADLTSFAGYDGRFDTVIDSAVFHALPVQGRDGYLASLARATAPGALLHVLVFAREAFAGLEGGPNTVDDAELRAAVSRHWTIDSVTESTISTLLSPHVRPELRIDERGFMVMPAYLLAAHRD
jgi:SAM-dependent methyltransferase